MIKFLKRRSARKKIPSTAESSECSGPVVSPLSLGTGNFSVSGSVESFLPSKNRRDVEAAPPIKSLAKEPKVFSRRISSFLRVSDLQMKESNEIKEGGIPHFDHVSDHPPFSGIVADTNELWVALDDGLGKHAPVAPAAVQALASTGLKTTLLSEMWTADWKTSRLLKQQQGEGWISCTFDLNQPIPESPAENHEVLLWSGKFNHGFYGSDLPAIRAAAVIDMPAKELLDLLVDSSRVSEYNAISLGRQDLVVLQSDSDNGPFGGTTKLICSESRPPMLRKTLRFTSLLHARTLSDENGVYQLVTRAITNTTTHDSAQHHHVLMSEILLGVNVIRRINDKQCLFVSVNHIRSPMVPMMIAKRLGAQAAVNFIHDLRRCC